MARPPSNGLPQRDVDLADAVWDLCGEVRVEVTRLEGLCRAVYHRRVVTTGQLQRRVAASLRTIGERHLRVAEKLAG